MDRTLLNVMWCSHCVLASAESSEQQGSLFVCLFVCFTARFARPRFSAVVSIPFIPYSCLDYASFVT